MSLNDLDFNAEHDPDLVALVSDKTPRRDVSLIELQEKLNGAMQKLSEIHRLVVTLHDVQGLSHEDISKIMGCNNRDSTLPAILRRQAIAGLSVRLFEVIMNPSPEPFDRLGKLLALKRHEPPRRVTSSFLGQNHRPNRG